LSSVGELKTARLRTARGVWSSKKATCSAGALNIRQWYVLLPSMVCDEGCVCGGVGQPGQSATCVWYVHKASWRQPADFAQLKPYCLWCSSVNAPRVPGFRSIKLWT